MDEETRRAAWAVYVSLHNLAASHVLGPVPTIARDDGADLGDIDDALHQLNRHEEVLFRADPGIVEQIRDAVAGWDSRPATRLVTLLPLLDSLAEIAGAALPPVLPPT
ncbi:hypothetical protein OG241_06670 [Streptomyces sp. NBC_01390]|uniref:hypothetical protein n=1 Tax=Streptomyces sp. NBC_01390 TaxID=2903850 RepID=UPI00324E0F77